MEAPETFAIIKRWWLLKLSGREIKETKEDKKSWLVPIAAVGLFIIVGGIIFETFAEGKVSDFDALLRAHESDKITAAESQAASAIQAAGTAGGSATVASGAADRAKQTADSADSAAKEAEETVEKVGKQANDIGRVIETMQSLVSARTIGDPPKLKAELAPFNGKTIAFRSYVGDPEAFILCLQLLSLLQPEIAVRNECGTQAPSAFIQTGVVVFGTTDEEMKSLKKALSDGGVGGGVNAGQSENLPRSPTSVIFVGMKVPFVMMTMPDKPPKKKQTSKP